MLRLCHRQRSMLLTHAQVMAQQGEQPDQATVKAGPEAHPLPALQDVLWDTGPEVRAARITFLHAWARDGMFVCPLQPGFARCSVLTACLSAKEPVVTASDPPLPEQPVSGDTISGPMTMREVRGGAGPAAEPEPTQQEAAQGQVHCYEVAINVQAVFAFQHTDKPACTPGSCWLLIHACINNGPWLFLMRSVNSPALAQADSLWALAVRRQH